MKVTTYLIYLIVSVALTIWVATTLRRNGRAFLVDAFHDNDELADSVNHLLVVGFYLINLGYVTLALVITQPIVDWSESIEALSRKLGLVLLVLGGMHFLNLFVFNSVRRRTTIGGQPEPPVRHDAWAFAPPNAYAGPTGYAPPDPQAADQQQPPVRRQPSRPAGQ